jgi:hypothetical protein
VERNGKVNAPQSHFQGETVVIKSQDTELLPNRNIGAECIGI